MLRALWGIADPDQLAALGKLLDEKVEEMGISGDHEARQRLAERIMSLFNQGITEPEDIRRRLGSGRTP
ncbi:hypothetical protein [Mesorhizobium argentiipisi]|uniref:Uncharacterized protein n=1 Tax=Mesorhizobium argentiipisi TaxID=3015175 RepID=A0ABU8KJN9_9HYPH